jgi:hypothetical protein
LTHNFKRYFARLGRVKSDLRASMAVEFAIVGPIFFLLLFIVFEISYDLFLQEVLDSSLAVTARQVQLGTAQGQTTAAGFNQAYFCPNSFGFLNCNNLFIRVEPINTSLQSTCTDLYDATTGVLPISGGVLQLGSYENTGGLGLGSTIPATKCDTATNNGFCNAGKQELVLISAIYLAPSFIRGLLVPGTQVYKYNGSWVRAQFAATAFETENFTVTATGNKC